MKRFEVRTTGKVFSSWTDQYCLFRRAREVQGDPFDWQWRVRRLWPRRHLFWRCGDGSRRTALFFFGGSLLSPGM